MSELPKSSDSEPVAPPVSAAGAPDYVPIIESRPRKPRRRRRPASERQIAANRANAARSTGPASPPGKARSSQNAVKHGLATAKFTVVRLEDTDEIARIRAGLVAAYQPVNSEELAALEQMATCRQQIHRAARLESGLFSSCMNESFGPEGAPTLPFHEATVDGIEVTRGLNRNFILADGFQILNRHGDSFKLYLRYQSQVERLYRRAVEEYERVKKLRPELPNEPITEADLAPEPEESTTDSPSPEISPNEPISGDGGAGASACQFPSEPRPAGSGQPPLVPDPQSPVPEPQSLAPAPPVDKTKGSSLIGKVAMVMAMVTALAAPCFGWGEQGHRLVLRTAESFLTPAAKTQVAATSIPGESIQDLAAWAGTVRPTRTDTEEWYYRRVALCALLENVPLARTIACAGFEALRRMGSGLTASAAFPKATPGFGNSCGATLAAMPLSFGPTLAPPKSNGADPLGVRPATSAPAAAVTSGPFRASR